MAQQDEAGNISWVEFSPQYHAHLVKCTIALVPHPIQKVKKVMFMYILELLNREGPQSILKLAKGLRLRSQAQKAKKQLAQKRNRASRREHWKQVEEAVEG